jgi:hypothetical protein
MSDETPRPETRQPSDRKEHKASSKDITPLLKGWDYEPGTINVRKINGLDGAPKLQMRLDLGLLQMELTGRPDGGKPHGCESLLDYYEVQLGEHKRRNGTELGFSLTTEQCAALREEAGLYYHRYLGLYVLEDFPGVVRDTARNLRVLDFCGKFAVDEQDRLVLEQYRPYITMMNTRAEAAILKNEKPPRYTEALAVVRSRSFARRLAISAKNCRSIRSPSFRRSWTRPSVPSTTKRRRESATKSNGKPKRARNAYREFDPFEPEPTDRPWAFLSTNHRITFHHARSRHRTSRR